MPPFVTCLGPLGDVDSQFPDFEFRYDPDAGTGALMASATIAVFTADQTTAVDFNPAETTPIATTTATESPAALPTALTYGSYVAYIFATDEDGVDSARCSSAFSVMVLLPAATRPAEPVGSRLGCGSHRVFIQTRGGHSVLGELDWTTVGYGRKVDDMTDARVTVASSGLGDDGCCALLAQLQAWQHELAIWRNGEQVWVGVLGDAEYTNEGATIPARDLFQWFERRVLPKNRTFVNTDLALVFRQYVLDALSRDKSPNITLQVFGSSTSGDRSVLAAARRVAGDELRELARTGVDFTMIGRKLMVGGTELPLAPLATLYGSVVDSPTLTVRGLDMTSEVTVVGATDENSQIPHAGIAGGVGAFGLVQTVVTETSIKDNASCAAAARTRLDLLSGSASFLSLTLRPEAPVDFTDLIPGTRWPVALVVGCREVVDDLRLAEVAVSATTSDQGDTEAITVTLEPLGTTDDDAS